VIKYAAPVAGAAAGAYAGPIGAVMGAKYAKDLTGQIKLMEELAPDPRQKNREAHTPLLRVKLAALPLFLAMGATLPLQ